MFQLLVVSRENPSLPPLALFDVLQTVDYRNLSVQFHKNAIHLVVDRYSILLQKIIVYSSLALESKTHVSEIFWPLGIGDKVVNLSLQVVWYIYQYMVVCFKVRRGEMLVGIDESSLNVKDCRILNPSLETLVEDHWFADRSASILASLLEPALESTICSAFTKYLREMHHREISYVYFHLQMPLYRELPIHELLPRKARQYLTAQNATVYYKLRTIRVEEQQLMVLARIEWAQIVCNILC